MPDNDALIAELLDADVVGSLQGVNPLQKLVKIVQCEDSAKTFSYHRLAVDTARGGKNG